MSCVTGIVFLGTPHKGSNFSLLAQMQISFGSWFTGTSTCPELIHIMNLDSSLLSYIQSSFRDLRTASDLFKLRVWCFYEKKQIKVPPMLVVTERSACLDDSEPMGLDANHMELNKYGPGSDSNYEAVYRALVQSCTEAPAVTLSRFESRLYDTYGSNADLKGLQRWLNPSDQQAMQLRIKSTPQSLNPYTCLWLSDLQSFQDWRSCLTQRKVIWVRGKPGSGKSVLAAFVIKSLRSWLSGEDHNATPLATPHHTDAVCRPCQDSRIRGKVLYFFFGIDRNHETRESFLGTLIHQLLKTYQDDQKMQNIAQRMYRAHSDLASSEVLLQLFKSLIAGSGPT